MADQATKAEMIDQMTASETASDRVIVSISGADREAFLSNLISNEIKPQGQGLSYAALLTPQGKYLADFFLLNRGEDILLDVAEVLAPGLAQRLSMYRLRADVGIDAVDLPVARGLGRAPEGAWPDPRHASLGWRAYGQNGGGGSIDWDAIRVAHCIPESSIELQPNDGYILEAGFERLNGVDHRKGCYVGQEVTARMKHKTELRKGLVVVDVKGSAEIGAPIEHNGRAVGKLFTRSGDRAIAYLRFDRAKGAMRAGDADVTWDGQQPS